MKKESIEQDNFKALVKYEKWILILLGLNLLLRLFVGEFYYYPGGLGGVRFIFWIAILNYLDKLIRTTTEYFKSSWCNKSKTVWWRWIGAVLFQYLVAPIWMHLIAYKFNGKQEQKSTLQILATVCDVLVISIYTSLFFILLNR